MVDSYISYEGQRGQKVVPFIMQGKERAELFSKYIMAIESGTIIAPDIRFMRDEHKYVTTDDLYGSGHPPDSFVAGSLAYRGLSEVTKRRGVRLL